jgi:hypothetical protein
MLLCTDSSSPVGVCSSVVNQLELALNERCLTAAPPRLSKHSTTNHATQTQRWHPASYLQLLLCVTLCLVIARLTRYTDWLPNHLLVLHVLLLFSVLNPLVLPFGMIYFGVERSEYINSCFLAHPNGNLQLLSRTRYIVPFGVGAFTNQVALSCFMFMPRSTKATPNCSSSAWFATRSMVRIWDETIAPDS